MAKVRALKPFSTTVHGNISQGQEFEVSAAHLASFVAHGMVEEVKEAVAKVEAVAQGVVAKVEAVAGEVVDEGAKALAEFEAAAEKISPAKPQTRGRK